MRRSRDNDPSRHFRFNVAIVSRVASSFCDRSSFEEPGSSTEDDTGARPHMVEARQEFEHLVHVLESQCR